MFVCAARRFRIAATLIACLCFQQAAVAAYNCSMEAPVPQAGAHCADMAMEAQPAPALCEKHCAPDATLLAEAAAHQVPALPPAPLSFAPMQALPSSQLSYRREMPISGSDPPPRLRYCSLLI